VADALRDLEVQARSEKAAIAAIKAAVGKPIVLPTPDELVERALALESLLAGEPLRAREALRRLFVDGRVVLHPQPEGHYIAEGRFLPLVVLTEAPAAAHAELTIANPRTARPEALLTPLERFVEHGTTRPAERGGPHCPAISCAGAQVHAVYRFYVGFERRLVA
jgi:hypothetical protein